MQAFEDPSHVGNGANYLTGKACWMGCGRPAGTLWSPVLCQPCNVLRMRKINDSMQRIEENLDRMVQGPDRS